MYFLSWKTFALLGYEKVYHFLLHAHAERSDGRLHEASVDAHERLVRLDHFHLACTERVNAAVVEELAAHEEVEAFDELRHAGMVDHAHVEQSVIRHGVRRLSVACSVADADGHHVALHGVGVYLQVHAVLESLENHEHERAEERERARTEEVACLSAQVHDGSDESDVDAVEEVAAARLAVLVGVAYAAEVNLAHATLLEPLDGLLVVALAESPEMGEVVHESVGYHAERNGLAYASLGEHEAVDGVVKRRVAADDDNSLVSAIDHHLHQALHACRVLALQVVVLDAVRLQASLNLLPALAGVERLVFRAVEYAPTVVVNHIVSLF